MPGVEVLNAHFFNEFTLRTPRPAAELVEALARARDHRRPAGLAARCRAPGSTTCIVVASTEVNTTDDRAAYAEALAQCSAIAPGADRDEQTRPPDPPGTPPTRSRRGTFTGNRGLDMEEALIFETGRLDATGVDFDAPAPFASRLGALRATAPIGLPGLTEPEAVRHYVRLSRNNYSIDAGLYPLGSCTMKHNPRLNEKMARLPGFADVHPLQPVSTAQGALAADRRAGAARCSTLTGMSAVAMSPKAGAHGELCGMMAIKAAIAARGEDGRATSCWCPNSAHGTNPATAALIGFSVRAVPAGADGTVERRGGARGARRPTSPRSC